VRPARATTAGVEGDRDRAHPVASRGVCAADPTPAPLFYGRRAAAATLTRGTPAALHPLPPRPPLLSAPAGGAADHPPTAEGAA